MAFYHNLDPVLLHLGPLEIRWYGVMYALSFLFIYWYLKKRSKENKINLSEEQIDSIMLWGTIALLIGARFFALLWDIPYYTKYPLEIMAFWKGGLSFHGGLVGVIIATYFLCKKYNILFWSIADTLVVPFALGQAFGRLGNFFNGELYGIPTTLPWGMNFHNELDVLGNPVFRHPSQLYEVGYNLIIFGTLWFLKDKKLSQGYLFALFLIMYAVFRFLNEFIRAPELLLGQLTLAQWLTIPMFVIGIRLLKK